MTNEELEQIRKIVREEIKWPEVEEACKRIGNEISIQESSTGTASTQFDGFLEDLKLALFGYWVARKDIDRLKAEVKSWELGYCGLHSKMSCREAHLDDAMRIEKLKDDVEF